MYTYVNIYKSHIYKNAFIQIFDIFLAYVTSSKKNIH